MREGLTSPTPDGLSLAKALERWLESRFSRRLADRVEQVKEAGKGPAG
jgi:hypothetical protein